jgi:hypothetical protein
MTSRNYSKYVYQKDEGKQSDNKGSERLEEKCLKLASSKKKLEQYTPGGIRHVLGKFEK